ncbi:hypothetical protein IWQ60_008220 [Tieghemiomyces parasiticus]|uniref:TLC domain-containing protein n=1 Tax=Tieghemiomyces parasiticus TaxID=78921 RepID=A0A9W8A183_9FUNG|nr:hypothetical protein IWQ60_008220 [Tieghemiomyces parasiticus]
MTNDNAQRIGKAFLAYSALHLVVEKLFVPRLDPRAVAHLSRSDRIELVEKIPSTVNGLVSGLLGMYVIHVQRGFRGDVFKPYPRLLDRLFSGFAGYCLYDLGIMALQANRDPAMWAHHAAGFLGATLMTVYRQAAFFPTAFMITELTVVPTNLLWYIQKLGADRSAPGVAAVWYRRVAIARAVAFVALRLTTTWFVLWYALYNTPSVDGQSAGPGAAGDETKPVVGLRRQVCCRRRLHDLWYQFSCLPRVVSVLTTINVSLLTILNLNWTLTVVRNLRRLLQNP